MLNSCRRAHSPDSVADDQSVCGESSRSGTRARKTEAERIEFLQNDPLTGDVEAHRVFCKECDEWVDLAPKRKYVMQNWNVHRKQKHKQRASDKWVAGSLLQLMYRLTG